MATLFQIGKLARATGLSVKTIRFYETRDLLTASSRSEGGYRLYSEADLHRLEFIKQAKALGLTLEEIRELVVASRERACAMTRPLLLKRLDERIDQTSRQILALKRLKQELEHRRQALLSRPPTDHGRGYCACLEDDKPAPTQLLKIEPRMSARAGSRERR